MEHPGTGMSRTAILLNGITRGAACHHCRRHRIPWAKLGNGLTSTTERVGHSPGGSAHCSAWLRAQFLACCLAIPSRTALGSSRRSPLPRDGADNGPRVPLAPLCCPYVRRGKRGCQQQNVALGLG